MFITIIDKIKSLVAFNVSFGDKSSQLLFKILHELVFTRQSIELQAIKIQ